MVTSAIPETWQGLCNWSVLTGHMAGLDVYRTHFSEPRPAGSGIIKFTNIARLNAGTGLSLWPQAIVYEFLHMAEKAQVHLCSRRSRAAKMSGQMKAGCLTALYRKEADLQVRRELYQVFELTLTLLAVADADKVHFTFGIGAYVQSLCMFQGPSFTQTPSTLASAQQQGKP